MLLLGAAVGALSWPEPAAPAGDPVQIAGVVPWTVDGSCGDEHPLTSATQVAPARAEMVTATLR
jgi:hypothetical protein